MAITLHREHHVWPLATPFRISRGLRTEINVVHVQLHDGVHMGRGESLPYAHYGETVESVIAQIDSVAGELAAGANRAGLAALLPAGAARNALDCALWDLEFRRTGIGATRQLGRDPLPALHSAYTVSLDTPDNMRIAAAKLSTLDLIKVKVDAHAPDAAIRAVREAAPNPRLIVDPNESWSIELLREIQPLLLEARVSVIEQPLPAGEDDVLAGFDARVPVCADESCHVTEDLARLKGRYQAINIKLDKTGGLTEALHLLQTARADGFEIMVGCMLATSLGIAPAFHVARDAAFIDLDGPLWIRDDYADGVRLRDGMLQPALPGFWGD